MLQRHGRTIEGIAITVKALDGNYARASMPIASMNEAIRDTRRPAKSFNLGLFTGSSLPAIALK